MKDPDQIQASVRRVIQHEIEKIHDSSNGAMRKANAAGRLMSGAHMQLIYDSCRSGYRQACQRAANQIAEIEGADAVLHVHMLSEELENSQGDIIEILYSYATPGHSKEALKSQIEPLAGKLQFAMYEISRGIVDDLRLGIVDGKNVVRLGPGAVVIDNRQGTGQIQVHSPGASASIGGNQFTITGVDRAAILALLAQVRDGLRDTGAANEIVNSVEDDVIAIERELAAKSPNRSRLNRLLTGLGSRANTIGLSVVADVITNYVISALS